MKKNLDSEKLKNAEYLLSFLLNESAKKIIKQLTSNPQGLAVKEIHYSIYPNRSYDNHVSRTLKWLLLIGIVQKRKVGRNIIYCIDNVGFQKIQIIIRNLVNLLPRRKSTKR